MIHILRQNESLSDIEKIYSVKESEIKLLNSNAFFCENSCLWVDSGGIVEFCESDKSKKIHPYISHNGVHLSAIHTVLSCDDGFVPVDKWGSNFSEIFVDAYRLSQDTHELILPYDYPSINACTINKITPSFLIGDPVLFCEDPSLNALLTDLSFKEYQNVLITARTPKEYTAALKLGEILKADNFGMNLALSYKLLSYAKDVSLFDLIYYQTEKNVIDFDSFSQRVLAFIECFTPSRTGVLYSPGFVDVNKNNGKILYADSQTAKELFDASRLKCVLFDDDSQLCYFRYKESNCFEHTMLFEDMRSFYAKASFMLKNGIKNICFSSCDEVSFVFSKIIGLVK